MTGGTDPGEPLRRARELHARGVAATAAARPAAGAGLHQAGLRLLGWPGPLPDPEHAGLAARLLVSLAFAESELGRTDLGLELLAGAERLVLPADLGVLLQQRGLLLMRTGRTAEVLPLLDAAVPLLSGPEHAAVLTRTLLNRGLLHSASGRIGPAREDLRRCRQLAEASGSALMVAKAVHNLGVCELLAGDIPAALQAYAEAERDNPAVILLNFSGVDYINSTGIALIVSLLARARNPPPPDRLRPQRALRRDLPDHTPGRLYDRFPK